MKVNSITVLKKRTPSIRKERQYVKNIFQYNAALYFDIDVVESMVNIPSKQERHSEGILKSLEEKIKEFQKIQELKHPKLPMMSHHNDDEWLGMEYSQIVRNISINSYFKRIKFETDNTTDISSWRFVRNMKDTVADTIFLYTRISLINYLVRQIKNKRLHD